MQAPHLTQPGKFFTSFEGPGRFGPMAARAPPCVGRLHGVLALLPSAQIAPVAHARLVQSFPTDHPSIVRIDCLRGDAHSASLQVMLYRGLASHVLVIFIGI